MPARIQRERTPGWRAVDATTNPNGYVFVGRGPGSRFGNPFVIGVDADDQAHATALYREWLEHNSYEVHAPNSSAEHRQEMDARRDWIITHAADLAGRDLMCWCPLPEPGQPDHCHAAVLLRLANAATPAP